jgi:hypothetical protein
LIDDTKYGLLKKGWQEPHVLLGLLRELIFKSTKLLPSHSFAELQQFDISVQKRLSLN